MLGKAGRQRRAGGKERWNFHYLPSYEPCNDALTYVLPACNSVTKSVGWSGGRPAGCSPVARPASMAWQWHAWRSSSNKKVCSRRVIPYGYTSAPFSFEMSAGTTATHTGSSQEDSVWPGRSSSRRRQMDGWIERTNDRFYGALKYRPTQVGVSSLPQPGRNREISYYYIGVRSISCRFLFRCN